MVRFHFKLRNVEPSKKYLNKVINATNYSDMQELLSKEYPQGDKIHRMGQGFSHMLQMMTSEFIRSLERTDFSYEGENTSFNNSTHEKSVNTGLLINYKEQKNSDIFNDKKMPKIQLPKVKTFSKKYHY